MVRAGAPAAAPGRAGGCGRSSARGVYRETSSKLDRSDLETKIACRLESE